jgi:hypothetical protein
LKYYIKNKDIIYGAKADDRGPIGGGPGYHEIISDGDYVATNLEELIVSLDTCKAGQVIFIPGNVEIDMSGRVLIDNFLLKIPSNIIVASDRGRVKNIITGEISQGALIYTDTAPPKSTVNYSYRNQITLGSRSKLTGLRIQGPHPRRLLDHHRRCFGPIDTLGSKYYYKFPTQRGVVAGTEAEISNCEISAWSHAGIITFSKLINVHHNFIHHCQHHGLGYGVSLYGGSATIKFNLFQDNRHSIAATGKKTEQYIAVNNVVLPGDLTNNHAHDFDMHRSDGHGGDKIEIFNNTFLSAKRPVHIRGNPVTGANIYRNWFANGYCDNAVAGINFDNVSVNYSAIGQNPVTLRHVTE